MTLLIRFLTSFVTKLNSIDFPTHKRKDHKIFFLFYDYSICVCFILIDHFEEISVIEKGDSWVLSLLLRNHLFFSFFFKIPQLVHAKNRLIQQLFLQFLVESNSHQYESKEWPLGLLFPYKEPDGHKYPL